MTAHTLRSLAKDRDPRELHELCLRWGRAPHPATDVDSACSWLSVRMADPEAVKSRLSGLQPKFADLLHSFHLAFGAMLTRTEVFAPGNGQTSAKPGSKLVGFELEAGLAALVREGLLWPARSRTWQDLDASGFAIPSELQQSLTSLRAVESCRLQELLSLQGWLLARYFKEDQARGSALDAAERTRQADHARKVYKLYLLPQSIEGRVKALPAATKALYHSVLVDHGGFFPLEDAAGQAPKALDVDLSRRVLEEAFLGTIAKLPLERVGVQPTQAVVLFHEVVLHGLQADSEKRPVEVTQIATCGIDLLTNLARFLREIATGELQFTSEGRLYKASEKRIARSLIAVPGGFLDAEALTSWLYKFCVQKRLVDRRGARALGLTEAGLAFEKLLLAKKLETLLGFAIEERDLPGEAFHQVRLRRYFLKLLKRARVEQWHSALFLPFLARAAYLPTLDADGVRAYFASRSPTGTCTPVETIQSLCWNLLAFVKRRLFPLGIVDLGMVSGRAVAMRLSKLGADLLVDVPGQKVVGERASVIVNPDFELLVFPGDDLHDLLHSLDRFARRTKSDHVHHYQLTRESVRDAAQAGLCHAEICRELVDRARVPVPQNVLYTLEDWCRGSTP